MTPAELEAIKAREQAATLGPWVWGAFFDRDEGHRDFLKSTNLEETHDGDDYDILCCYTPGSARVDDGEVADSLNYVVGDEPTEPDAAFIAHARTDVPALVAEVETGWAAIHDLHEQLQAGVECVWTVWRGSPPELLAIFRSPADANARAAERPGDWVVKWIITG